MKFLNPVFLILVCAFGRSSYAMDSDIPASKRPTPVVNPKKIQQKKTEERFHTPPSRVTSPCAAEAVAAALQSYYDSPCGGGLRLVSPPCLVSGGLSRLDDEFPGRPARG